MKEVSPDLPARKRSAAKPPPPPATVAAHAEENVEANAEENTSAYPKADGAKMVKPVVNALEILRYLTKSGAPERAVDIARALGINQSTCFNILRTLVAEDVAAFDVLSKTYTVGLGLANLVGQFVTQGQRVEVARPLMRELAGRFAVTTTLWRPIGAERIVLVSSEVSPTDLRIDMAEGQRLPYLMGASGRLFAGQREHEQGDDELRAVFDKLRWSEPLTFEKYLREVAEAKRRGYAIDDGNFARGIMAIAAPVHDERGAIAFAISAVMFRNQFDKAGIAALGKALNELGKKLSDMLF